MYTIRRAVYCIPHVMYYDIPYIYIFSMLNIIIHNTNSCGKVQYNFSIYAINVIAPYTQSTSGTYIQKHKKKIYVLRYTLCSL